MPAVTSQSISGDKTKINFVGTNFPTSGYTGKVTFGGTDADSVTITSATTIEATYTYAVPLKDIAEKPIVRFVSNSSPNYIHFASVATTLINAFTASNEVSTISCSFAGGCNI